jgi:hypothetical protein
VAEGARLESVYALIAYRGFESLSHRQILKAPPKERSFDNLKIAEFLFCDKNCLNRQISSHR